MVSADTGAVRAGTRKGAGGMVGCEGAENWGDSSPCRIGCKVARPVEYF